MRRATFRDCLEYAAFRTAQALVTIAPIPWTGAVLKGLTRVVFRLIWPLKRENISRIREVFGEETSVERCRFIARTSVWNMLMNFVELFHAARIDTAYLDAHVEGTTETRATLQRYVDKYGGVVVALPHMGNWDLAAVACSRFGFPLMALGRPQNNPLFDRWYHNSRLTVETIDRRKPSQFVRIAHHLKSGGLFAILPDVRHNKPGVGVTVFGKPDVQLGRGLAKFARMANVPILPFFMTRLDSDHHRIELGEPIFPDPDADPDADAIRVTQATWDTFEERIRRAPEQWFWHNRRWILTPLYTQTRHKHGKQK